MFERTFSITLKYTRRRRTRVLVAKSVSLLKPLKKVTCVCVGSIDFMCSCSKIYNSYEALLTHAKRYSHAVNGKYKSFLR